MRTNKVLSVSLPEEMLHRVESLARAENPTMSELLREALRTYENFRIGEKSTRFGSGSKPASSAKS